MRELQILTLGARGFSCAVSGFGQVLSLRPWAEHVSACSQQKEAPRRTREKTSGTQGNTYSTSSAMFVTGIVLLFRSNCPLGSGKEYLWTRLYYAANQKHAFLALLGKSDSKHLLFLVLHPRFHHQNFRFLHVHSVVLLLQPNLSFSSF